VWIMARLKSITQPHLHGQGDDGVTGPAVALMRVRRIAGPGTQPTTRYDKVRETAQKLSNK